MNEFYIKNANIIDGTGAPAKLASVHIKNGVILRISQIEAHNNCSGEVIDAQGMCLAPGFIDAHGHSDISIIATPRAEGKVSQGITTEICGNCGLSVFPVTQRNREHLEQIYKRYDVKISWNSFCEFRKVIDSVKPAINFASLLGHNTLRASVAGYEKKELDASELSEMKNLAELSLSEGAAGFSTGFLYVPGCFSKKEEIIALLKINASFGKIYTTHLRSEGDFLIEALTETIENCISAKQDSLHISHLKTAGKKNWTKISELLSLIEGKKSVNISADRYPFVESMTNLSAYLPKFFRETDDLSIVKFLSEPGGEGKATEMLSSLDEQFWNSIRLVSSSSDLYSAYSGMKFIEIARISEKTPAQICLELLKDAPSATAAMSGMSPENMKKIIGLPYVCCGTDESVRSVDYRFGRSHPRGFASIPEFIKIAIGAMSIEEVVRKLTSLPAKIFRLRRKGLLREGYDADLVLFTPEKLRANANFANPHQLSDGIEKVWVNGVLTWQNGQSTEKRAGHFISL